MPGWIHQAAAVPVRDGKVCMVTSSTGRRWVFPKGMIDPGHTAGETALNETWEEAGLVGVLDAEPLGNYVYAKYGGEYHVLVFRMTVTEIRDEWPERGQRQRVWLTPDEALERIEEPGLREIIRHTFKLSLVEQRSN
jgi:8-oxo-dGTP pyrophosphatase MutT (NUDIX family)